MNGFAPVTHNSVAAHRAYDKAMTPTSAIGATVLHTIASLRGAIPRQCTEALFVIFDRTLRYNKWSDFIKRRDFAEIPRTHLSRESAVYLVRQYGEDAVQSARSAMHFSGYSISRSAFFRGVEILVELGVVTRTQDASSSGKSPRNATLYRINVDVLLTLRAHFYDATYQASGTVGPFETHYSRLTQLPQSVFDGFPSHVRAKLLMEHRKCRPVRSNIRPKIIREVKK